MESLNYNYIYRNNTSIYDIGNELKKKHGIVENKYKLLFENKKLNALNENDNNIYNIVIQYDVFMNCKF